MRFATLTLLGMLSLVALHSFAGEPRKSSPVVVEKTGLSFDPKTCTAGKGMFFWSLGSVEVTIVGHKDGQCVFDYKWEVEQAGGYQVHRVRVPIDSGVVRIAAESFKGQEKGDETNRWSQVYTTFTAKQAKLIRTADRNGVKEFPE